ncbi:neprilysin, partial [Aphelenchoides avenae]
LMYAHDEHAPWKVRVNEALRNNGEFSEAFACSEEAWMNSRDKCYVWNDKPREDAREKNAVNRIAASTLAAVASVLFVLLNYY